MDSGLAGKINVSFESVHRLRRLNGLREPARDSERIRTGRSASVEVLALKSFSVNRDGGRLSVVALGHALLQLFIGGLLSATPHASLNTELVVTVGHSQRGTVLRAHNLLSNHVSGQVFLGELRPVPRIEVTLLASALLLLLLGLHLCGDLRSDFPFEVLGFQTDAGDLLCGVAAVAPSARGSLHEGGHPFAIDAAGRIVELLVNDGVLEIQVTFGDVLPNHGPKEAKKLTKLPLC